jgi:hypothetical protein
LEQFNEERFVIHIHPSNQKNFSEYKTIPNLFVHDKLSYKNLVKTMSRYDFGLVLFNENIGPNVKIFLYALGNKAFDYLCAGIPIIAQDCLPEVVSLVKNNTFGYLLSEFPDKNESVFSEYQYFVDNILKKRGLYTSETQSTDLLDFYYEVIRNYTSG